MNSTISYSGKLLPFDVFAILLDGNITERTWGLTSLWRSTALSTKVREVKHYLLPLTLVGSYSDSAFFVFLTACPRFHAAQGSAQRQVLCFWTVWSRVLHSYLQFNSGGWKFSHEGLRRERKAHAWGFSVASTKRGCCSDQSYVRRGLCPMGNSEGRYYCTGLPKHW